MRPIHILLVDDHEDTLHVMKLLLESASQRVICAKSFAEAMSFARIQRFDIGILDLFLPDGTGYTLRAELQAIQELPCIALSAAGTPSDVARSLSAGFCRHLLKPCPIEELNQVIRECLSPPPEVARANLSTI